MCTLGVGPQEVLPDRALSGETLESLRKICFGGPSGKAEGDLCQLQEPSVDETSPKKSKKQNKNPKPQQPAIPVDQGKSGQARASAIRPDPQVKAYLCEMRDHVEQAVDKYLELSGKTRAQLAKVPTPCLDDHLIPVEEFQIKG